MNRYKLYFLSCVCMLGMISGAAAQDSNTVILINRGAIDKETYRIPWLYTATGCIESAMERIHKDYSGLLQEARNKGILVQLTIRADDFDIETYLSRGVPGDDVIFNFYATPLCATDTSKGNCKGALWVGAVPLQLR